MGRGVLDGYGDLVRGDRAAWPPHPAPTPEPADPLSDTSTKTDADSKAGRRALFTPVVDEALAGIYAGARFVGRFFVEAVRPPWHLREVLNQCHAVGLRSLFLITTTGFVTGIVFTKQSRPSLAEFGGTSWLPSLITIAMVRSLAPLVTALICAGKVGSGIGAELASMKVTEQIEAMEVSAINPFKYLVVTRTLATTLMVPALTLYCGAVGLTGSFLNIHANEGTSLRAFLTNGFAQISFLDLSASISRATVYGFTIGIIAAYKGFHASSGTRGVGRAANAAVVLAIFAIFFEEVLAVQIVSFFAQM